MNLHYRKIGNSGQPLIILHGLFGMSDNWLTISKEFAKNHEVYLLDLRNHGQSPKADGFNYQLMASDLAEFIVNHNIEKPILLGHSMGGKVVMQFAVNNPEIADKIIVVDIAPKYYPVHHSEILRGLEAVNLSKLQSRTEANDVLKAYEPSEGTRQFLIKNLFRNEQLGHFDWRFNLAVISKYITNVGEEITSKSPLKSKILFISGSESGYINAEDEKSILAIFPNATFAIIKGASHWVQADKPAEFVEVVNSFL